MGIYICIFLGFIAVVAKWLTTYRLKLMRAELALLEAESQKREESRQQFVDAVDSWKSEREVLGYDCRGLSKDLRTLNTQIDEFENVERKIAEKRPDDLF